MLAYHESRPLFEAIILYLLAANAWKAPPLIFHVHVHATITITSLHKAILINLLLLQEFYPCSMLENIHVQQTYSLHEATST